MFDPITAVKDLFVQWPSEPIPSHPLIRPEDNRKPISPDWSGSKAINEGMKASSWVFTAIRKLSEAGSHVPWVAKVKQGDEWVRKPGHPIENLINVPNPYMGRQGLIERMIQHTCVTGNTLTFKSLLSRKMKGASQNAVAELTPLVPIGFEPIKDRKKWIRAYQYKANGKVEGSIPSIKIVHGLIPDPGNPYWGISPLQAVARAVDIEKDAQLWQRSSLQNMAVTSGVFFTDKELSDEQYKEARHRVWEQGGSPDMARYPFVMDNNWKWEQMALTAIEMDLINSRKMLREEILAVYGIPPTVAGIFEAGNSTIAEPARKAFWADAVVPMLGRIQEAFEAFLIPHFGDRERLRIEPDYSNVEALQESMENKSKTFQRLVEFGVPYNEASQILDLGLKHQEQGDEPFGILHPTKQNRQRELAGPFSQDRDESEFEEEDRERPSLENE